MRSSNFSNIILVVITIFGLLTILNFNTITEAKESKPIKVAYKDLSPTAKKQVECLAQNIYYEAGWEPEEGQVAVAMVTMNRVEDGRFANTICGVVKQKEGTVCQFSWFCEKRAKAMIDKGLLTVENNSVYNKITDMALNFYLYTETFKDPTKGALFFHADYVKPTWSNIRHTAQIGRHIFYNKVKRST
mgnify:CR=1 FL=1